MTRSQIILSFGLVALSGFLGVEAQNVTGSTTIDVDQATNTLVVTCETDVDDGDYEPSVQCNLYDDSGTRVASQGYTPSYNAPYAEAVITYTGKPGVTYTAIGTHIAICNITDPVEGGIVYFDDPYNFEYYEGLTQNQVNYYDWYGPGPDTQSRTRSIKIGNTTAKATVGLLPTSEITTFYGFSANDTRGLFEMFLYPANLNYDGNTVTESDYQPGTDTCYWGDPAIPQNPSVEGSSWTVGTNPPGHNGYGLDRIGFAPDAVRYIRTNFPDKGKNWSCTVTLYQRMSFNGTAYQYNMLTQTIAAGTVTVCRAYVCHTAAY